MSEAGADKIGLSKAGLRLLSRLRVAQSPEELFKDGLSARLLSQMLEGGLLEPQRHTVGPTDYQEAYLNWSSQRGMLLDHTRTRAFRRAIETLVKAGDRVVDVGTGSGILAMFAARAGAVESVGLEFTEMAAWAERLAKANGLSAIRIVRGDAAEYCAERPIDLVMGEFAGMWLIDEWRHYAAFCAVRDRNLREGGTVLPRAARLYLSAIDSRKLYLVRGYGFWEAPVQGFDFSGVRCAEIAHPRRWIITADPNNIVDTKEIAAFDFLWGSERDCCFTAEARFTYPAAGKFHGVVGHFEMDMAPGQVLSTGPSEHDTHWHQSYFPMPAMDVPAGGSVTVRVRTFIDEDSGIMQVALAVAGEGEALAADTREHIYVIE
jgi:SAM-dependent methyltransferase